MEMNKNEAPTTDGGTYNRVYFHKVANDATACTRAARALSICFVNRNRPKDEAMRDCFQQGLDILYRLIALRIPTETEDGCRKNQVMEDLIAMLELMRNRASIHKILGFTETHLPLGLDLSPNPWDDETATDTTHGEKHDDQK